MNRIKKLSEFQQELYSKHKYRSPLNTDQEREDFLNKIKKLNDNTLNKTEKLVKFQNIDFRCLFQEIEEEQLKQKRNQKFRNNENLIQTFNAFPPMINVKRDEIEIEDAPRDENHIFKMKQKRKFNESMRGSKEA